MAVVATLQRPRSLAPDLARGLMLLLIACANVGWYLWGHPTDGTSVHPTDGGPLDSALQDVLRVAVDGRIYPMFAFLLGYGMVQFQRSRWASGVPEANIRRMLRRRHWWMLLFGLVHAALLFVGDILGTYALAGLLLVWVFWRRSDKVLKVWVGVLLGLLALVALGTIAAGAYVSVNGIDATPPAGGDADAFSIGWAIMTTAGLPDYPVTVLNRVVGWAVTTPLGLFGSGTVVAILLGWLAARHLLLDDPVAHRRTLGRMAAIDIPLGWAGGVPDVLARHDLWSLQGAPWAFSMLTYATGLAAGLGYVGLFGLVAARWQGTGRPLPRPLRAVAAVGQRSLTFYLAQSIVLAPLLSAWGLGLGNRVNTAGALGIATLVWLVSVVAADRLQAAGRRGPFEVLLRRLTYGRWDAAPPAPATRPGA